MALTTSQKRKIRETVTKRVFDLLAPLDLDIRRDRLGRRYGYDIHSNLFVEGPDVGKVKQTLKDGGLVLRLDSESWMDSRVEIDISTYVYAVEGVRVVGNRLECSSDWTLDRFKEAIGVKKDKLSEASKERAIMAGATLA